MPKSSASFRREKWFWAANVPAWMALYTFDRPLYNVLSIPYLIFVSIYSLVKGAGGQEQAAEAREAAEKD